MNVSVCVWGSYGACTCVLVHTQEPLKEAGRVRPDLIASPQKLSLPSPPKSLSNGARTAQAVGSGVRRLGFESGPASNELAFPSLHFLVCKKGASLHFSENEVMHSSREKLPVPFLPAPYFANPSNQMAARTISIQC